MKDLFVLTADKNAQFAIEGALHRTEALGIRDISFDIRVHVGRDGGVRTTGVQTVAAIRKQYRHALMVLDFEGSGARQAAAEDLERELDQALSVMWDNRAKAIVVDPEIDVWMWGSDNVLRDILRWPSHPQIRDWIQEQQFVVSQGTGKPLRPKEALEAVLRQCRQPRSSSLYKKISARISLSRCNDPAFLRTHETLRRWFESAAAEA